MMFHYDAIDTAIVADRNAEFRDQSSDACPAN
jgi:hypothetical protein